MQRFYSRLSIGERHSASSHCKQSLLECLSELNSQGGFGILAHVDAPSGFETETPGASPHKLNVLCHPGLLGIELKHAGSTVSHSDIDPDQERIRIGRERISRLRLGTQQYLARVLNSDAHTLTALGRNAGRQKRVTRYKMDSVSFEGLRVALEDADARVRIEDQIPQSIPMILGAKIEGGFLTGQTVHFSGNLNCIIGGRGTGKSTIGFQKSDLMTYTQVREHARQLELLMHES